MEDKKKYYIDYLVSHNLLSLATADENGNPYVRSVEYANDGPDIYFLTDARSTKVKHIKNNANVAFTVDEDLSDWSKIQGIQMRGKASIIEDKEQKESAVQMLITKFPQFTEMLAQGNEILCVIKIKPTSGIFIDNPAGRGMRYDIQYN